MSELLSTIITPELRAAGMAVVVFLVLLYILCIVWVVRDSYLRGTKWMVWGVVALVPVLGVIAYCLLRPPLYQIDQDEQQLEIAFKQRALNHYGECGNCGYPVENDYLVCPQCRATLKHSCAHCGKPLDPSWIVCPYCTASVQPHRQRPRRAPESQRQVQATEVLSD